MDRLRLRYEAEGYRVAQGIECELPPSLRSLQPDLLFVRGEEKVWVELISRPAQDESKLREIAATLARTEGWRFDLVVWNQESDDPAEAPGILSNLDIGRNFAVGKALVLMGYREAAILTLGAVLETVLRAKLGTGEATDYPASGLLKQAYSDGLIERDMMVESERWLLARNRVVHGFESAEDAADLVKFIHQLQPDLSIAA